MYLHICIHVQIYTRRITHAHTAQVLEGVEQLTGKAGQDVVLQYPHPDGTRMVKLADADAWQTLLDLAADPDWDLDGFMEIEVMAE